MGLEARPLARRLARLSGVRVIRVGIGVRWPPDLGAAGTVIVCGVGGALSADLEPGTVFVPDRLALSSGGSVELDPGLGAELRGAVARLGIDAAAGGLLTATRMVTGAERREWARRGFHLVDMETGLVAASGRRLAGIRVVLDTPRHELSPRWGRPGRAALDPRLWGQMVWLARFAPAYADRAARVVAEALRHRA
ncbi:MAG: hypothetical protein ACREPA_00120 [Candidatus Dormibacteraceae bacterium]